MTVDSRSVALNLTGLRAAIQSDTHKDEAACIRDLLDRVVLNESIRQRIRERACALVQRCRMRRIDRAPLDAFLQEFGLSNQEGVALMCLAEALLRIPDSATANQLIHEKILSGDWQAHVGHSDSLFVNASTLGLVFTGSVISLDGEITRNPATWLKRLAAKLGEPVIRTVVMRAMQIMGDQYVLGRNIEEACHRGQKEAPPGALFSFDMLGEGARTLKQSDRYFDAYLDAIARIAGLGSSGSIYSNHSISVKLSALYPRYEPAHRQRVMVELLPRVATLAKAAKMAGLGFTIDAEESERLDISLDIFEMLAGDGQLAGWDGLGMVVQAYQKRAPRVIDWLRSLAQVTGRRFTVRLVKGAYWDREIKFAQERGLADFPVYTLKPATDLSYQLCVEQLFAASGHLYPQFATHNAYSIALILEIAGDQPFEFQRLYGMGGLLYRELLESAGYSSPLRVYAPVGEQRDLLPYLVRRLLENGANSSFVNRFLDEEVPIPELVEDPVELLKASEILRHPLIPRPVDIYRASQSEGGARDNSAGIDLDNPLAVEKLYEGMKGAATRQWLAGPVINGQLCTEGEYSEVFSPAHDGLAVGKNYRVRDEHIESALASAAAAQANWDMAGGAARGKILEHAAELLERHKPSLMWLIAREGGRTLPDALSEVREAVDFCRYYALKSREHFENPLPLPGPTGEDNSLSLHGRGVFLCISPWNFPLAIFAGQVAAALAAGNSVIAKPAEQTPLIAAEAVRLFHAAGVPGEVLHLLPGAGSKIGPKLIGDLRISGVALTGSTETAWIINRQLAGRNGPIVPLIAETGGQNAMVVDSSALPEQVVDDVIRSTFLSAGQRCSALRVLYLQKEIADDIIGMLKGALELLEVGDPLALSTDIGPVIDRPALGKLQRHIAGFRENGNPVTCYPQQKIPAAGSFCGPCIIEIESMQQLHAEVFGPILHIIRYQDAELDDVLREIDHSGYGLTLGIHTRIGSKADYIFNRTRIGNTYINRSMVGAVVGVQPFGGQGLSGTGPKAGGPHYLFRFATEKAKSINTSATGGNPPLYNL